MTIAIRPALTDSFSASAPGQLLLAGGPRTFEDCDYLWRKAGGGVARRHGDLSQLKAWAQERGLTAEVAATLDALQTPRGCFAGLTLEDSLVMAVVNVTPDSFSDGGDHFQVETAIAAGRAMRAAGAAILDIGGESTRPGAEPVSVDQELERVLPVVRALAGEGAVVSIDSRHAAVMRAAVEAGAKIINDVTALSGDPKSLRAAAESGAAVVLMHMLGDPQTMQRNPSYEDVTLDVYGYLEGRIAACEAAGIARSRIAIDPGIGFGKTVAHNLQLLDDLAAFHGLGCPLLLGVSRKRFIGHLAGEELPKGRLPGSLAAALAGIARGVQIVRVHDVAETVQALKIWNAVAGARLPIN